MCERKIPSQSLLLPGPVGCERGGRGVCTRALNGKGSPDLYLVGYPWEIKSLEWM